MRACSLHAPAALLQRLAINLQRHSRTFLSNTFKHTTHTPTLRNIFPIWALGLYKRLVLGGAKRLGAEGRKPGDAAGWVCAVSDYYTA